MLFKLVIRSIRFYTKEPNRSVWEEHVRGMAQGWEKEVSAICRSLIEGATQILLVLEGTGIGVGELNGSASGVMRSLIKLGRLKGFERDEQEK